MNPFINAGAFLITTLFGLYILAIMLRLILQLVRADFRNVLSQFIVKVTNPPLKPLRRFIPGFAGIDMASVIMMLALQILKLFLLHILLYPSTPDPLGLIIFSLVKLISLGFYVFLFSIFILALLSWFSPDPYNPVIQILRQITEPVLRPARRLLPSTSGMDFSAMLAILVLWLCKLLLLDPLIHWIGTIYPVIHSLA
jgi:YggT family protein